MKKRGYLLICSIIIALTLFIGLDDIQVYASGLCNSIFNHNLLAIDEDTCYTECNDFCADYGISAANWNEYMNKCFCSCNQQFDGCSKCGTTKIPPTQNPCGTRTTKEECEDSYFAWEPDPTPMGTPMSQYCSYNAGNAPANCPCSWRGDYTAGGGHPDGGWCTEFELVLCEEPGFEIDLKIDEDQKKFEDLINYEGYIQPQTFSTVKNKDGTNSPSETKGAIVGTIYDDYTCSVIVKKAEWTEVTIAYLEDNINLIMEIRSDPSESFALLQGEFEFVECLETVEDMICKYKFSKDNLNKGERGDEIRCNAKKVVGDRGEVSNPIFVAKHQLMFIKHPYNLFIEPNMNEMDYIENDQVPYLIKWSEINDLNIEGEIKSQTAIKLIYIKERFMHKKNQNDFDRSRWVKAYNKLYRSRTYGSANILNDYNKFKREEGRVILANFEFLKKNGLNWDATIYDIPVFSVSRTHIDVYGFAALAVINDEIKKDFWGDPTFKQIPKNSPTGHILLAQSELKEKGTIFKNPSPLHHEYGHFWRYCDVYHKANYELQNAAFSLGESSGCINTLYLDNKGNGIYPNPFDPSLLGGTYYSDLDTVVPPTNINYNFKTTYGGAFIKETKILIHDPSDVCPLRSEEYGNC